MNEQNSVLNIIGKVSGLLSKYIAVVILITSAIAFTHPQKFMWIPQYTALFLGTAMFGMGLTIKREDFQIVFSRPKEVISGCILQYTIMPLAAYFLAVVMNLDTDIALGVILVGCCPGGTASNVIAYIAKGDVPLSVGMTITSTLIAPLVTPVLVYLLAVRSRAFLPADDCPLIQTKSDHDGLNRTTMGQQGHHQDDQFFARPQPVEGRAFALAEGRTAYMADVATFFSAVNTDIPLADLSSCRTGRIVAKYGLRVHWLASLSDWSQTELANGFRFLSTCTPTTV